MSQDIWYLPKAEKNHLRVTEKEDIIILERLRQHMFTTSNRFEELLGDLLLFDSDQIWENPSFEVEFFARDDERSIFVERMDSEEDISIIFGIREPGPRREKPELFGDVVTGTFEQIIDLADTLIKEWHTCRPKE